MIREQDISRRLYRPVDLYNAYGSSEQVPWEQVQAVIEMVEQSPRGWTARLVWEELRQAGRDDISEETVALVMDAGIEM